MGPSLHGALAVLIGLSMLGAAACRSAGSERIVGPDGSPMAHVHCGSDQGACFRIAGELCPTGYELKPVLRGNDGNFLVRCRAPNAPTGVAPREAAAASAGQGSLPLTPTPTPLRSGAPGPSDSWPPSNEPAPAADPWPPPQVGTGPQAPPPPSAHPEVDLGY